MGSIKRTVVAASFTTIGIALFLGSAHGQVYPERPIRVVVPYVAGASFDTIVRIIGEPLNQSLNQPVIVENRLGASGMIGAAALAKATPDGYTIGMLGDNHSILAATGRKTPYDLFKDFAPIMRVATTDYVVVVPPSSRTT